jgi:hypothetical protein
MKGNTQNGNPAPEIFTPTPNSPRHNPTQNARVPVDGQEVVLMSDLLIGGL